MFSQKQMDFLRHDVLDERCEKHGCQLYGKQIPTKYMTFCPECTTEDIQVRNMELARYSAQDIERYRTHGLLERASLISPELRTATFETYCCDTVWHKEALGFAQKATRHYYTGGAGNVVFGGQPGVGKSHLSLSMLRCLNDQFAKSGNFKTAIFMPVAQLFSKITASMKGEGDFTEARAIELLTGCDFLVLDDFGKESSYSLSVKPANDWKQSVLFNILNNRERTIITTNFNSKQLAQIYDSALIDRLFRGDESLRYRFNEKMTSRRH